MISFEGRRLIDDLQEWSVSHGAEGGQSESRDSMYRAKDALEEYIEQLEANQK